MPVRTDQDKPLASLRLKRPVEATAPTRVDLAGGTLDLWPLYLLHPGSVTVNAAIKPGVWVQVAPQKGVGIRLTDRDRRRTVAWQDAAKIHAHPRYELFGQVLRTFSVDQGVRIQFSSGVPRGAGLAGSSALLVAFCSALLRSARQVMLRDRFLALIRDIETRLIKVPAGTQDYYPALWGGIQALWWGPGGVVRESLPVLPGELERRLILVYTGTSRHSGKNNWEVFKRRLDGDRNVRRIFEKIVEAGQAMVAAIRQGDYCGVGKAMADEATARSRLFPGIVPAGLRDLERSLRRLGAIGIKVCGAGGGGCVAVYADPDRKSGLEGRIREEGYHLLPFKIVKKGLSFHRMEG